MSQRDDDRDFDDPPAAGSSEAAEEAIDSLVDGHVQAAVAGAERNEASGGGEGEGEASEAETAGGGDMLDLDALLAAEADVAFGDPEGVDAGSTRPGPAVREEAFLDLAGLEREAAGLPAETPGRAADEPPASATPPPDPAVEAVADSTPAPAPAPPADAAPATATATASMHADRGEAEAEAPPADAPGSRRLRLLPLVALLDRPVRVLGGALPPRVGPTPAERTRALRLAIGLAGACLAFPGLAMLALGLLRG